VTGLDEPIELIFAGLEVTIYEVIGLPPSEAGAVKLTIAWALPATAVTPVGVPGTVIITAKVAVAVLSLPRLVKVQVALPVPLPEGDPPLAEQSPHVAVEFAAAEAVRTTD
jgi:hypothetical protein